MQILPSKQLLAHIKHYLILETSGQGIKKLRLFSDGHPGIVFCFKHNLISNDGQFNSLNYLPGSFIYGQISRFKDVYLPGGASLIIAVFQPGGLNTLAGLHAGELKDKIIRTEDVFGMHGLSLFDNLLNQPGIEDKMHVLNAFFLNLISKQSSPHQLLIQASLHFIFKNKGAITVKQLVSHTGYTERHIERVFDENIGITPKKYASLTRLHSFLKLLKDKPKQNNITGLCYQAGYSDQSHLIKEFRKYTGITPTQYLNDTSRLAINFMEMNAMALPVSGLYNLPG